MPDSPAVDLWRRRFKLNLSASWKRDVEKTVTDLDLWKEILDGWFYFDASGKKRTKHPGIKGLLTEYERREMEGRDKRNNQANALSPRSRARVSEGRDGYLQTVRVEPPSLYFRVD